MPWLVESAEWVLIHRLGSLLAQRTGRYVPRHSPAPCLGRGERFNDKLFDAELARVFLLTGFDSSGLELTPAVFEDGKNVLRGVCDLLNSLVATDLFQDDLQPSGYIVVDATYPALETLIHFLDGLSSTECNEVFDLATGPSRRLFQLPDNASLRSKLTELTAWNDSMQRLFFGSLDETSDAKPRPRRQPWKDMRRRDETTDAFQLLFKGQDCHSHHEVKLGLSQRTGTSWLDPTLHIWYFCSDADHWQEVIYDLSG